MTEQKKELSAAQEKAIQDNLEKDPTWIDTMLLAGCLKDKQFYLKVANTLCINPTKGSFYRDFDRVYDAVIYKGIRSIWSTKSKDDNVFNETDFKLLERFIKTSVNTHEGVTEDEEVDAYKRISEVKVLDFHSYRAGIEFIYPQWLQEGRFRKLIADTHLGVEDIDAGELTTRLKDISKTVESIASRDKKTLISPLDVINAKEEPIRRIACGMPKLDGALGGGFGCKEMTLIVAPRGSGKTVVACQFGTQFALNGKAGMVITTEQPPVELYPRVFSALSRGIIEMNPNLRGSMEPIPFDKIKDGVKHALFGNKLTALQKQSISYIAEQLTGNFYIEDWSQGNKLSIETDLELCIDRFEDTVGKKCEWVIFDWVGRGLGKTYEDPGMQRLALQRTVDTLVDIARMRDMATVGMAQAHPQQAANKKRVDDTMVPDNKTLGVNATAVFGISALPTDPNAADDGSAASYQDEQFFYVSKSRKSQGRLIPVTRDFGYQRFKER